VSEKRGKVCRNNDLFSEDVRNLAPNVGTDFRINKSRAAIVVRSGISAAAHASNTSADLFHGRFFCGLTHALNVML
jgi:hypothetical protein